MDRDLPNSANSMRGIFVDSLTGFYLWEPEHEPVLLTMDLERKTDFEIDFRGEKLKCRLHGGETLNQAYCYH